MSSINLRITKPVNQAFFYNKEESVKFEGKAEIPPELENTSLYYRWYSSSFSGLSLDGTKVLYYSLHKEALTSLEKPYSHSLGIGSHIITLAVSDQPGESKDDLKKIKHGGVTGGAQGEYSCIIYILKANIISPKEGSILSRSGFTLKAEAPVAWEDDNYQKYNRLAYRWRLVPSGRPAGRPAIDTGKIKPDELKFIEENTPSIVEYQLDPGLFIKDVVSFKKMIGNYQIHLIVADKDGNEYTHEDTRMIKLVS